MVDTTGGTSGPLARFLPSPGAELKRAILELHKEGVWISKDNVVRDKNGREMYKFASLADLMNGIRKWRIDREILVQFCLWADPVSGFNTLYVLVQHLPSSQQETASAVLGKVQDPQDYGGLITYFQRYLLQGLLAIPAEDDDAHNYREDRRARLEEQRQRKKAKEGGQEPPGAAASSPASGGAPSQPRGRQEPPGAAQTPAETAGPAGLDRRAANETAVLLKRISAALDGASTPAHYATARRELKTVWNGLTPKQRTEMQAKTDAALERVARGIQNDFGLRDALKNTPRDQRSGLFEDWIAILKAPVGSSTAAVRIPEDEMPVYHRYREIVEAELTGGGGRRG